MPNKLDSFHVCTDDVWCHSSFLDPKLWRKNFKLYLKNISEKSEIEDLKKYNNQNVILEKF